MRSSNRSDSSDVSSLGMNSITRGSAFMPRNGARSEARHRRRISRSVVRDRRDTFQRLSPATPALMGRVAPHALLSNEVLSLRSFEICREAECFGLFLWTILRLSRAGPATIRDICIQ
jgi:hypothetical protein